MRRAAELQPRGCTSGIGATPWWLEHQYFRSKNSRTFVCQQDVSTGDSGCKLMGAAIMTVLVPQHSKFDRFLFAVVIERDGTPVTVVSLLSRLDRDPWQEAARLSELTRSEAINSLAAMIWRSNCPPVTASQAHQIAAELVRYLPSRDDLVDQTMNQEAADLSTMWLIFAIFVGMMAVTERHVPNSGQDIPVQSLAVDQVELPARYYSEREQKD